MNKDTMIPLNIESIKKFLLSVKLDAQFQKETNQIFIISKIQNQDVPLFIRVMEGGDLLQLLYFLPLNIDPKNNADLSRLLHLVNKELDIPGFGMDETAGVLFYRVMLPSTQKKIDGAMLESFVRSMLSVIETFLPVIGAVSQGLVGFDEVLEKAKEDVEQQKKNS